MKIYLKGAINIFLFFSLNCYSQNNQYSALNVGDIIPDIEIKNIINYQVAKSKISDFRGKLLILDFWGTWCSPCISAFPKLDSLQRKFSEKIQILPVTEESEVKVSDFLLRMKKIKGVLPPTVTDDKILYKIFKHTIIPHYVWIDKNGKVLAITDGSSVTMENISSYLNGQNVILPEKKDAVVRFHRMPNRSLIVPAAYVKEDKDSIKLETLNQAEVLFHSTITRYNEGFGPMGGSFRQGVITLRNMPINLMYSIALGNGRSGGIKGSNLIIDIDDAILYKFITGKSKATDTSQKKSRLEYIAWAKENTYCYNLTIPNSMDSLKFDFMLENLNQYFGKLYGIEGVVEKRDIKYLALIKSSKDDKIATKGVNRSLTRDKFSLKIKNYTIQTLKQQLEILLHTTQIITDETGYTGKIDIELHGDLSDLKSVNKELEEYGLLLIETEQKMNVPIIRKRLKKLVN